MTQYQLERNHGCRVSDAWTFRGLKTAVIENELLRIVVLIDKGADIYQFVHKPSDTDFLWRSPWGVRDPSLRMPTTGSGEGLWMDVYEGGWQTVLPGGGFPTQYMGADMGLHAEVNTVPWDAVILEDTTEVVSMRFWVRAARTPFFFEKTLTLRSGSAVLEIEARLTNEGEEPVHCVWGEHIALGAPFLSEDCVIDLPGGTLINEELEDWHPNNKLKSGFNAPWPMSQLKDGTPRDLSRIPPKIFRSYDMSYIADMPDGWYAVTNQKTGIGFGFRYPTEVFRYLWYWHSFGGGFGYPWYGRTYNVGLEPFTSYGNSGLAGAVENGTALLVQPGQTVETSQRAVAYSGASRVRSISSDGDVTIESNAALQGS